MFQLSDFSCSFITLFLLMADVVFTLSFRFIYRIQNSVFIVDRKFDHKFSCKI